MSNKSERKNADVDILLVDDYFFDVEWFQFFLDPKIKCEWVTDGEKALQYLQANPHPKLIVSDFHMPCMNGIELLKAIRSDKNLSHLKFILCSSVYMGREAMEAGANYFFEKSGSIEGQESVMRIVMDFLKAD